MTSAARPSGPDGGRVLLTQFMPSIFQDFKAYQTLYDSTVAVRGGRENGRRIAATFAAAVMPCGFDGAITEEAGRSARRLYTVLVPRQGAKSWGPQYPSPHIGDELTLADGLRLLVKQIAAPIGMDWELEAREK